MMAMKRPLTENLLVGKFAEQVRGDRALRKLNTLAKDVTGLFLVVLVRTEHQMLELHPAEGAMGLPPFCRIFRRVSGGLGHCLTCRSLAVFGANYQGLYEYTCHGGVSVIASPALRRDGQVSEHVAVASCAFALDSHLIAWPQVESHALELGADTEALKHAFYQLPVACAHKRYLAREITELAALVLGEIEERVEREHGMPPGATGPDSRISAAALDGYRTTLGLARGRHIESANGTSGSLLVDLVMAMVQRDPAVPYTEAGIAAAASVTPHHFATHFQQHAGTTFRSFLLARRIGRAQALLRDPRLDVAEVGERSGFSDPAYFVRRFQRETGCTPLAWRAANGGPAVGRERSNDIDTTGAPSHSMGEWGAATKSFGKE